MTKIKVGIIGSAGYTGGELLRVLIFHPHVEIVYANSVSNAGNKVYQVHTDLIGDTQLSFSSEIHSEVDVVFLCLGHGDSKKFLEENQFEPHVKIIDLAQDFRLSHLSNFQNKEFVYGLPELNREEIKKANYVANPGCFATNIQLSLLPLAFHQKLPNEIHVNATTGSTGAGQKPSLTSHFSWRSNNLSVYKAFDHQHLQEISESLNQLQSGFLPAEKKDLLSAAKEKIHFLPQRGAFPRGIFSSIYVKSYWSLNEAKEYFQSYYESHPFTHVSDVNIDLKQVVNTNKSLIYLEKHGDNLLILNAIDNLLKGASGQAVQNMNLMFGLEEAAGLKLKSIGF